MSSPYEVWKFGWFEPYQDREAYIASLPEHEQAWAKHMFWLQDLAFAEMVYRRADDLRDTTPLTDKSEMVEQIRESVRMKLKPKQD